VVIFFIETRGVTLEEVAKIFDGEDAQVAHLDVDTVDEKRHAEIEVHGEVSQVESVQQGQEQRYVEKV
jgi:chromosome segregation and condensation protein ScpB